MYIFVEFACTDACVAENKHWIVPHSVNSLFTGRSELVNRIESALRNDALSTTSQKRLVITGMGGMGKSEVCLKVADLMREECVAELRHAMSQCVC